MNIVKISTTGTEGRFTNRLSEAIHINPYSKIGLQNIVAYPHVGIDIDSTNDTFTSRTAATYPSFNTVTLTHGNYTINTLLIEIQRAMNASLVISSNFINQTNFQWKTILKILNYIFKQIILLLDN